VLKSVKSKGQVLSAAGKTEMGENETKMKKKLIMVT
jgi:hypothetical protein